MRFVYIVTLKTMSEEISSKIVRKMREETVSEPPEVKKLSRRQQKNKNRKRNRREAIGRSILGGTACSAQESYLKRRAVQYDRLSQRQFKSALVDAKQAARIEV